MIGKFHNLRGDLKVSEGLSYLLSQSFGKQWTSIIFRILAGYTWLKIKHLHICPESAELLFQ